MSAPSSTMNKTLISAFFISFSLLIHTTYSDGEDVRQALITFIAQLSNNNGVSDPTKGWNSTSDPCKDHWEGVFCDNKTQSVNKIFLNGLNFSGIFNPNTLCSVQTLSDHLTIISLNGNSLRGGDLDTIVNCKQLTQFHISGNQFSGALPNSLSRLNNLKRLDISGNRFSGGLPDLARISGLKVFLAQNNDLSGLIPSFDFSNLDAFNVSFNNFSGEIPRGGDRFRAESYIDNPELCGDPLPNKCAAVISQASPPETKEESNLKPKSNNGYSKDQILIYSGYFLIGLAAVLVILLKVCKKGKAKDQTVDVHNHNYKVAAIEDSSKKPIFVSSESKAGLSKSGGLISSAAASAESGVVSSSLVVLTSPEVNGLKFEELLRAPAELIGRGKHGSVYKVICEDQRTTLAVKRVKDWAIGSSDFKRRMQRLDQVKHPNVLPAMAFYCSKQEKLLVYEYQHNGSLCSFLHGTQMSHAFDWSSRLGVAATISEALAFMHDELHSDGIPHGNLKTSNILVNKNMEPCISEYGLMEVVENQDLSSLSTSLTNHQLSSEDHRNDANFKSDIYGFGVILLELLTGKISAVQNNGMGLAKWVVSVVREEWTVEVFDKTLIREGASEERMVNLLQVAIKCVNQSPEARPSINQVALMINTIKEEEERSMDVSEA